MDETPQTDALPAVFPFRQQIDLAMREAVERISRCFEELSPQRVERLGEIYAGNARFCDPFNDVQGLAEIQRIFRHMYVTLESPRFVICERLVDGQQCVMTWDFEFRFRNFDRGTTQTVHGASHLVLNNDGLITLHQDYWDPAQGLYEKIPLIGAFMRWLRKRAGS